MGRLWSRGHGPGLPFSEREVKQSLYSALMGIPQGPDTDLWTFSAFLSVGGGALGYAHERNASWSSCHGNSVIVTALPVSTLCHAMGMRTVLDLMGPTVRIPMARDSVSTQCV